MPPKKGQPSKPEPKVKQDIVEEAPLQAVLLADSYNRRFEVLCTDTPRILLPLCSTPLLSWTLESLSLSKVKQVFVFCGVHAEKIREFVSTSPYRHLMDIRCLSSQTARTAGDALRELDAMQVLDPENPFILVHSPIISNYDISKMVDAHKKRREVDKNVIMTMGVGRGGRRHPETPILLVHPASSRLLHYHPHPLLPSQSRLTLPLALFTDPYPTNMDTFEIWSGTTTSPGYRDLGVDICEADVPALCTENFDYHDLRRHFVNGVLTSELLGKRIGVHVVGSGAEAGEGGRYIERIRDTRTFGEITRDVLRRWSFPLVPDLNEPGGVQYELRKGNVYIAKDNVVLSRSTTLTGPLLIGPRSALQQNTDIHQSTLGADSSIGPGTTVTRCYAFDDVRIGANCTLEECIIGKSVILADGVRVGRGALIGDGVRLGKGVRVPDFARVGRERFRAEDWDEDEDDDEETEQERERRLEVLGPDTLGYLWPTEEEEPSSDSDSDGEDPYEHPRNKTLLQLGRSLSNLSSSTTSLSTLSAASTPESLAESDTSLPDIPSLILDQGPPPAFYNEAKSSLERAYEEDHSCENALLELRTLVMGYNAGLDRARVEVTNFLMSKIEVEGKGAGEVLKNATRVFGRWGPLAVGLSGERVGLVCDVQGYCARVGGEGEKGMFGVLVRGLYEGDVVGEGDLVAWRDGVGRQVGEGVDEVVWRELWEKGKVYVDVLEDMESESEEDDEDEDEDEEDEDGDED